MREHWGDQNKDEIQTCTKIQHQNQDSLPLSNCILITHSFTNMQANHPLL